MLVVGVLVVGVPVIMAPAVAETMVAVVLSNHKPDRAPRRATACGAHISSHLNRRDLEVLPRQHRDLGAAAWADGNGAVRLEVDAADAAATQTGRLGDLQAGTFQVGSLGDQVEAEPHRVGRYAGQGADLQAHAGNPLVRQTPGHRVNDAFRDGQFVHYARSSSSACSARYPCPRCVRLACSLSLLAR